MTYWWRLSGDSGIRTGRLHTSFRSNWWDGNGAFWIAKYCETFWTLSGWFSQLEIRGNELVEPSSFSLDELSLSSCWSLFAVGSLDMLKNEKLNTSHTCACFKIYHSCTIYVLITRLRARDTVRSVSPNFSKQVRSGPFGPLRKINTTAGTIAMHSL